MLNNYQCGNLLFRRQLKALAAFAFLMLPFLGNASDKFYHYTPDGKTTFELSNTKVLIKFSSQISFDRQARIFAQEPLLKPLHKDMMMPAPKVVLAELNSKATESEILALVDRLHSLEETEYSNPFLVYSDGSLEAAQDRVAIKLKDAGDFSAMERLVKENRAIILEQYKYDPLLYFIKVDKNSKMKALELANLLAETGNFAASEPDVLKLMKPFFSTNDTFLNYQWSLNNTGSSIQYSGTAGADMKVFSAWDISRGSSTIKVAILDEGVDLNHPDLLANMLPGFDGTGLGSNGGPSGNDAHGTSCAGIVAGVGNNNLGVAGVAHLCKIIPIRIAYSNTSGNWVTTNSQIGTSIDWAWNQGGADVLSNSWGGGSSSTLINDPITRAGTQGRGGLGAPVLFAAGNNNSSNSYPATLTNVISVIAMSMCNQRKTPTSCDGETWWGSNFGTGADVSAPGVKIYTTDISGSAGYSSGDYTPTFNGTSSATPNTSGVMALILSVNPTLTFAQARQILESTCDKVGGYTYNSSVSGQPNGTWSTDLGYGRVNAFTALQAANPQPCSIATIGGTASGPASFASGSTGTFVLSGYSGTDIQWQSSTDGGLNYSEIGGANSASSTFSLPSGTYKIRAAVSRVNCTVSYSNVLNLTVTSPLGDVFGNPILTTLPYSTSISTATSFTNGYTGTNNQTSADIFFRFTTGPCTDSVKISACGSNFDTYLHLLNSSGTWMVSNDDNGPLCTGTRSSIKQLLTPNTTYYLVAEGYSSYTGNVVLTIDEVDNPIFTTSISAGGSTTFCLGGSVTLTAGSGSSYLWSTGATTQTISASSSGNYSVSVSNSNGCSASASQSVTANPAPTPTISAGGPTTFCAGGSVVLTSSSASNYLWSNGATTQSITVSSAGNYSVAVTQNGCTGTSAATVVTVNPLPTPTISAGSSTTFCAGGSVVLTSSSASNYLWSNGATTQSITVSSAGNYSVSVSQNGCSGTSEATSVTINPLPTIFMTSGGGAYCSSPGTGTSVNLSGSEIGVHYEFKFTAGGTPATLSGTGFALTANGIIGVGTIYVVATNISTGCSTNMSGSASVFEETAGLLFRDLDEDGYGDPNNSIPSCSPVAGYVSNNNDCNDNNTNVNPGHSEICGNGIDDNCNGDIDEECLTFTFYQDSDGDGFGNPSVSLTQGTPVPPLGYVANNMDCNDGNADVNPNATEICNGIDDNCDGQIDNGTPALATSTAIDGPDGVCRNSTGQVFSIDPIPGATSYIWTLPTGATGSSTTNSISVAFSTTYATGSICVRAANSCVEGSDFCKSVLYYSSKPGTPGTISGITPVCPGSQASYSIGSVAKATSYSWTVPANATIISGQGTTSIMVEFASNYATATISVTASNCAGTSGLRTKSVAKSGLPGTPGVISGNSLVCPGNTIAYSIVNTSNTNSYNWTAPTNATISSGQGTNSVEVTYLAGFVSGSLLVNGINCIGNSANRSLAIKTVTSSPKAIVGERFAVCAGSTQDFSCTEVIGATTYLWTVPEGATINSGQGTNAISVTFPAEFASGKVTAQSGTECTYSTIRSITVRSIPSTPAITGPALEVCGGTATNFTCSVSTTGATFYTWTVPVGGTIISGQGTNEVQLSMPEGYISGVITVSAGNACGSSANRSKTLRSVPSTPGVISGPTSNLCGGTYTYSLAGSVATATSYTWTAPAGCTVFNNGLSADITVPSTSVSGYVSVVANNGCGASSPRNLTITSKPATPSIIDGPTAVCPSATGLVFTTTEIAGLTYTWAKPSSVTITDGQGTATSTMDWGTIAGSISVKATNACGNSGSRTKAITIAACRNGAPIDFNSEVAESADVSVFPNPSSGIFNLELKGTENGQVLIYNMQGQKVYEVESTNLTESVLDLSHLPAGAYLLKYQAEGFTKNLKVIKQ